MTNILQAIGNKENTIGVFLDIAKALTQRTRSKLFQKLEHFGNCACAAYKLLPNRKRIGK